MKGQIFSLDFVISVALVVLVIGMTLNYYDMASNQEKEARIKAELTSIATSASTIILEKYRCTDATFENQGYSMPNCSSFGLATSTTKPALLIPEGFNCNVKINGTASSNTGCATSDPASDVLDIVSIDRNYLTRSPSISKTDYEKCINNTIECYTVKKLTVTIWR